MSLLARVACWPFVGVDPTAASFSPLAQADRQFDVGLPIDEAGQFFAVQHAVAVGVELAERDLIEAEILAGELLFFGLLRLGAVA